MYFEGEDEDGSGEEEEEHEMKFAPPVKTELQEDYAEETLEEQDEYLQSVLENSCNYEGGDGGDKPQGKGEDRKTRKDAERTKRRETRKRVREKMVEEEDSLSEEGEKGEVSDCKRKRRTEEQKAREAERVRKKREEMRKLAAVGGSESEEARKAAEKLAAQRERNRLKAREKRAAMSEEKRKEAIRKDVERRRQKKAAAKTPEEIEREKEAKLERRRERNREWTRQKRAAMSEEERKEKQRKERAEARQRMRQTLSQAELEERKARDRERQRQRRAQMTAEQKEDEKRKLRLNNLEKKATMTDEQKKEERMRRYMEKVAKMAEMTEEEKEERRQKKYFMHRMIWERKTPEEKKKQVDKQRECRRRMFQDQRVKRAYYEKLKENYRKRVDKYKQRGEEGVRELRKRRRVEQEKQKLRKRLVAQGVSVEQIKKQVNELADRFRGNEGYKLLLKYSCNLCDPLQTRFGEKWEWEGHVMQFHPEVAVKRPREGGIKQPKQRFPCPNANCKVVRLTQEKIDAHIRGCTRSQGGGRWKQVVRTPTSCEVCGRVMAVNSLSEHYLKMHGVKEDPFQCLKKCGREFRIRESWLLHMEREHGIKVEEIGEEVIRKLSVREWDKVVIQNPEGFKGGIRPAKEGPRKSHVSTRHRLPKARQGEEDEGGSRKRKGPGRPKKLPLETEHHSSAENSSTYSYVPPATHGSENSTEGEHSGLPHTTHHPTPPVASSSSSTHFSFPPNTSTVAPPSFNFFDQMNYFQQNFQSPHHPPLGQGSYQPAAPSHLPPEYHHVYPKSPPRSPSPQHADHDDFDSDPGEMKGGNVPSTLAPGRKNKSTIRAKITPKRIQSYTARDYNGVVRTRTFRLDATCELCGVMYNSKNKRNHLEDYHNPHFDNGTCTPCGAYFTKRREFSMHFNQSHPELISDPFLKNPPTRIKGRKGKLEATNPDDVICSDCGRYFRKSHIQKHMDVIHNPHYVNGGCGVCGEKFFGGRNKGLRGRMFLKHLRTAHPDLWTGKPVRKRDMDPNKIICDTCGEQFSNKYRLQSHIHFKHGEGSNKDLWPECSICHLKVNNKYILKYHMKKVHGGVEGGTEATLIIECAKCGKKVEGREELKKHVEVEHPEAYFPCKQCNALRHSQIGLYLHWKSCTRKKMGEGEVRAYGSVKEYVGGVRVDNVPVACIVCEKMVALDVLRGHYKDTHGVKEDDFECDQCGKKFKTRSGGWYHMEMKHGVGEEELMGVMRQFVVKDREALVIKNTQKFTKERKPIAKKVPGGKKGVKRVKKVKECKSKEEVDLSGSSSSSSGEEEEEKVIRKNLPTRRSKKRVLINNVEKEKRLVISVKRLTEEEISEQRNMEGILI